MSKKYIEYYKCKACNHVWQHEWDDDDKNNDYDFNEISYEEYCECLKSK